MMARFVRSLALAVVTSVVVVSAALPDARAADAGAPAPSLPACVAVSTASRYVPYGYNHIVSVTNGCARDADCLVSTDVNPQQRAVAVAARQTAEVTTFMGSPSSTFTAKVTCKLR